MTWALTPWGQVCRAVADFVVDINEGFPQCSVGIGPDADDLADMDLRITFVPLDASFTNPRHGGGLETHPTFDESIPTRVKIHVPTDLDTAINEDKSPVLLNSIVTRFLEGCDAIRHTPYMVPNTHARRGGRIGEAGSTSILMVSIRVEYFRTPATMGTAIATTTTFGVQNPDGNGGTVVESFEVIGDAP